ncbi:DUF424 family protein [Candidatus Pacearchaeota archaeon]|nr:DUF424 family protein [Candidatus Pacearchaeota archaeon]
MGKDILLKIHKSYRWVVAVCDEELFGRKLIDGKRVLDLSGNFFKGDVMNCEEAQEEISRCNDEDATFNFVGERSVEIAKELGIVNDESVVDIDRVPFALALL